MSTTADLSEVPAELLRKGVLPGLWDTKTEIPTSEIKGYFAGGKTIQIDRGGYMEAQQIPKATDEVVKTAIGKAVLDGILWLVSGPTSMWKEEIPQGILTEVAALRPPPEPILAAGILEGTIPDAWKDGKTTVAGMLAQLSVQRGVPLPWVLLTQAVDGALRARLVELDPDSCPWPCDSILATKVVLKAVSGASGYGGGTAIGTAVVADNAYAVRAYLKPNELQDLADSLGDLLNLERQHGISIRYLLSLEATADGVIGDAAKGELADILGKISDAFH